MWAQRWGPAAAPFVPLTAQLKELAGGLMKMEVWEPWGRCSGRWTGSQEMNSQVVPQWASLCCPSASGLPFSSDPAAAMATNLTGWWLVEKGSEGAGSAHQPWAAMTHRQGSLRLPRPAGRDPAVPPCRALLLQHRASVPVRKLQKQRLCHFKQSSLLSVLLRAFSLIFLENYLIKNNFPNSDFPADR